MSEILKLSDRYTKNREKLVDIMYTLETFTVEELIEKMREENNGDIAIDSLQSISDFLVELSEFNNLEQTYGVYSVRKN